MKTKKIEKANVTEVKDLKVVKRTAEGLTLLKTLTGKAASNVRAIFSSVNPTNYKTKDTDKISQCSIINLRMKQGVVKKAIAEELIKIKLFPANSEKSYKDDKALFKACLSRINTHIQASKKRGISLT